MINQKSKTKQANCRQFTHRGRKANLTQYHFNKEVVLLDTGHHMEVDFNNDFKRKCSRVSKNLRTFLYLECNSRGWNYDNVIVNVSLPSTTKGIKTSYAGLTIMFPFAGEELKDNEAFAIQLIEQFHKELEILTPDEGKP